MILISTHNMRSFLVFCLIIFGGIFCFWFERKLHGKWPKLIQEQVNHPKSIKVYILGLLRELVLGVSILVPLGIIGYQAYLWLQNGHWVSIPLIYFFRDILELSIFTDASSWYYAPDSWLGFHSALFIFLEHFPLSLGIFLACLLVFWSLEQEE